MTSLRGAVSDPVVGQTNGRRCERGTLRRQPRRRYESRARSLSSPNLFSSGVASVLSRCMRNYSGEAEGRGGLAVLVACHGADGCEDDGGSVAGLSQPRPLNGEGGDHGSSPRRHPGRFPRQFIFPMYLFFTSFAARRSRPWCPAWVFCIRVW